VGRAAPGALREEADSYGGPCWYPRDARL